MLQVGSTSKTFSEVKKKKKSDTKATYYVTPFI